LPALTCLEAYESASVVANRMRGTNTWLAARLAADQQQRYY
jgi:hypothetical protein